MRNITTSMLLLWSSALSIHASTDIHLSEVLEDFSGKTIVQDSVFEDLQRQEGGSVDGDTISCDSVIDDLQRKLEKLDLSAKTKHILRYNLTALNDSTFQELTEKLLPLLPETPNSLIIDLSNNELTTNSLSWICRLLDHTSITWINIEGNDSLDKRNIKDVCAEMQKLMPDKIDTSAQKKLIQAYLEKLIFLPRSYVSTAKNRIKIYKDLEEQGYLPPSWDESHKKFYSTISSSPRLTVLTDEHLSSSSDEEIDTIDLHNQTINFSNCDKKMRPIETLDPEKVYKIDLRDNYIDDEVIEFLLNIVDSSKLHNHLKALDLSNNRITQKGLLKLLPLVQEKTFQWLAVPINCLDMRDIGGFMHALKEKARSVAPEQGVASDALALEWMKKIIWLPESYDLDSLPLDEKLKASHRAYYEAR